MSSHRKNSIAFKLYFYTVTIILMMSILSALIFVIKTMDNRSFESASRNINLLSETSDHMESIVGDLQSISFKSDSALEKKILDELSYVEEQLMSVRKGIRPEDKDSFHSLHGLFEILDNLRLIGNEIMYNESAVRSDIDRYEMLEYVIIIPGIYRTNVFRFVENELSSLEEIQEEIRNENRLLGIILMLFISFSMIIVFVLILFIKDNIIAPLKGLENAAESYQERNDFKALSYEKDDEIGHLNAAFSDMFEQVCLREKELKKLRNYLNNIIESMPSEIIGIDGSNAVSFDVTVFPVSGNGFEDLVIRMDDITERLKIEQVLVQNEKMLALGGLAAGMAHVINNPLSGVLNSAELLVMRLTDVTDESNIRTARDCGVSLPAMQS